MVTDEFSLAFPHSFIFACCCNTMLLLSTEGNCTLASTNVETDKKCVNSKKVINDFTFM